MTIRRAILAVVLAGVLGCTGCVWDPGTSDRSLPDDQSGPSQTEAPEAVESGPLEPPLTQDELEPLVTAAFEGFYEGLVLLRRGDIEVDALFEYATRELIEQQLRVFGSSIPADYVIDGFYAVAATEIPNAWESGTAVTTHVCIDHANVRILDADGAVLETEPVSRYTASTVLFEVSADETRFLVADILSLFPDAPEPCPAA